MSLTRPCPKCGADIPANSPAGLCPRCVLAGAMESPSAADPAREVTRSSPRGVNGGFVPPAPAEIAARFPQLEILELLGKGGMGAVYKARQRGLDRLVAIKILPPDVGDDPAFAERFTREARSLARLAHPHIVAVYDFGQTDGLYYFVMEFVDGVNLRQAITSGSLQAKDALSIVPQICDALQFAHDEGIVHRDIKPENILIDKKGRVKIADFGLAKMLGQEPDDRNLTATHQVMGTARYMAPEQMEGSRNVDHRADIYSLGVVFYEMLTGELPLGRFQPPSQKIQLDIRLDDVVLRTLAKEPQRRYQHASDVKSDVENISRSSPRRPAVTASGEVFPSQFLPRDVTDFVMGTAGLFPWVGGVFWLLPTVLLYLLCTLVGLPAESAFFGALWGGLGVFLTIFCVLAFGSVQSVRVDGDGLTFHRYIGPSKFLPWSAIRRIEPISRWEVFRRVWMWPGLPPRGSIICGSARDCYRFDAQNDCWYFSPSDPPRFLDAIARWEASPISAAQSSRRPGYASEVENISRSSPPASPFAPAAKETIAASRTDEDEFQDARDQVRGPAIGLLITGILHLVGFPLLLLIGMFIGLLMFWNHGPAPASSNFPEAYPEVVPYNESSGRAESSPQENLTTPPRAESSAPSGKGD